MQCRENSPTNAVTRRNLRTYYDFINNYSGGYKVAVLKFVLSNSRSLSGGISNVVTLLATMTLWKWHGVRSFCNLSFFFIVRRQKAELACLHRNIRVNDWLFLRNRYYNIVSDTCITTIEIIMYSKNISESRLKHTNRNLLQSV